jgi:hypothetical protein
MADVSNEERVIEKGHSPSERTIGTKPKAPIAHDEMRLRKHVRPYLNPYKVAQDIEDQSRSMPCRKPRGEGIVAKVVAMAQGGVWNGLDNAAHKLLEVTNLLQTPQTSQQKESTHEDLRQENSLWYF